MAKKTVREIWLLASQIFDAAMEDEYIIKAPTDSSRLVNPSDKVTARTALTGEQAREIAEAIPLLKEAEERKLIALYLYTGVRRGELLALKWENFEIIRDRKTKEQKRVLKVVEAVSIADKSSIKGTKTKKGCRTIPVPTALWEHLQPAQQTGYILGGDKPLTEGVYQGMMERIKKQIELHDATGHNFRHTYITLLAEDGVPLSIIQELAGHENIITTSGYTSPHQDVIVEAGLRIGDVLSTKESLM